MTIAGIINNSQSVISGKFESYFSMKTRKFQIFMILKKYSQSSTGLEKHITNVSTTCRRSVFARQTILTRYVVMREEKLI